MSSAASVQAAKTHEWFRRYCTPVHLLHGMRWGTYSGAEAIPEEWVRDVENLAMSRDVAQQLLRARGA